MKYKKKLLSSRGGRDERERGGDGRRPCKTQSLASTGDIFWGRGGGTRRLKADEIFRVKSEAQVDSLFDLLDLPIQERGREFRRP
jgi:hypothetical protein